MRNIIKNFIKLESASAYLLLACTVLALFLSNTPWDIYYNALLNHSLGFKLYGIEFSTQLLHLTNDGLMALFFLVVGLEIKYELLYGALNSWSKALLPGVGALGGMIVPAIFYAMINMDNKIALQGWAIPTATDIAFSLGVLTLLGSRISSALKIFLMTLAIFDDFAAIVIIAIFYTAHLSFLFLGLAVVCIGFLVILNIKKINPLYCYWIVGTGLWFCLMQGGVHPTLAGGILAFLMPFRSFSSIEQSPAFRLKHRLHRWVAFGILPLFAFVNAGIPFLFISSSDISMSVIMGILLGLLFGKPIGVFGFSWLSVKLRLLQLPTNIRWRDFFATSILCGIGFTISLFIGTLAFRDGSIYLNSVKIGVIFGSLISGLVGYGLLRKLNH